MASSQVANSELAMGECENHKPTGHDGKAIKAAIVAPMQNSEVGCMQNIDGEVGEPMHTDQWEEEGLVSAGMETVQGSSLRTWKKQARNKKGCETSDNKLAPVQLKRKGVAENAEKGSNGGGKKSRLSMEVQNLEECIQAVAVEQPCREQ